MHQLSLYLLGDFRVRLDDRAITRLFRTEKERALLAFLAVESDRPHTRDRLGELLWPDRPEGVARTNLRQALLGVRKAIRDREAQQPYLTVSDEHIQFMHYERLWLDASAYAKRFQSVFHHTHTSARSCVSCAQQLGEAVDLYRQSFLEGIYLKDSPEFQEWMYFHREQYERYLLLALDQLSEFFEFNGDYEKAHSYAWQYVKRAPLEEKAHRRLMQLLALTGRRSAAIEQYHTCRLALQTELGVEPARETIELFEKIRSGDVLQVQESPKVASPAAEIAPSSQLPTPLTAFVGRQPEMDWFASCLPNPSCRLITVTGMAGSGKTRLVVEAANHYASNFPDGVRYISLEGINAPELLAPSMARILGVTIRVDNPLPGMLNHLQNQKVLLVLDHFDHMIEQTGLLVEILQRAPGVKIVLTSRQRLNYQAACLYTLEGLPCPPSDANLGNLNDNPSLELLLARATRSRPGFEVNESNLPHLLQICRLVGGNPLAIELVASRLRELDSERLARQLEIGLEPLTTQLHDVPERHRSISAAIDSSWQVLDEPKRKIFAELSIFKGSFSAEAAESICGATPAVLAALVERSLTSRLPANRFRLAPLLRKYAHRKISNQRDELSSLEARYSRYYLSYLEERQVALKNENKRCRAVEELQAEYREIRAALEIATASNEQALAARGRKNLQLFEAALEAEQGQGIELAQVGPGDSLSIGGALSGMQSQDALTGLPNQQAFMAALRESLSKAASRGQPVAILVLDMKNPLGLPQNLNEEQRQNGLITISRRLRGCMRGSDLVAYLGENSFAFLFEDYPNQQAIEVITTKILGQLADPLEVQGKTIQVRGHIGVGLYPSDGDNPEALLEHTQAAIASQMGV